MSTGTGIDAAAWLRRWDAQQQLHIPDREERFQAIVDVVAASAGDHPRVLDLGCGPGSLSARILERIPDAEVVAIDADPVLLALGREALGGNERLHFVDADLRADWPAQLPLEAPFDAAVSTTALHWLGLPDLVRCYARLGGLLRQGGVFLDGDRLDYGAGQTEIGRLARAVQVAAEPAPQDAEEWDRWWDAVLREPAFAEAAAERARRGHDHPHDNAAHSYDFHRATLLAAGFREVGSVWQHGANRVLLAVR